MAAKSTSAPEPKATPVGPGEPEDDGIALSQLGSTFAERAKARAKVVKRVSKSDDDVEDKAVKKAASKKKS